MIKLADLFKRRGRVVVAVGVICLVALALAFLTSGISSPVMKTVRVDVYGWDPEIRFDLSTRNEVAVVTKAIRNGKRIRGILDVVQYNYRLELYNKQGVKISVLLWLYPESGMYMYAEDTHTGYTIKAADVAALNQLFAIKLSEDDDPPDDTGAIDEPAPGVEIPEALSVSTLILQHSLRVQEP